VKKLELQVAAPDENERLDRFIARAGGISRGEARRVLARGGVWVDQKRVQVGSRVVQLGQSGRVVFEEAGRTEPQTDALGPGRILHEDSALIAVDKPPFVAAQGPLATDRGSLIDLVSRHVGRQVGLVHRLDLETSGVTVFGKTREATSRLAAAFREGTARKRYLALAVGTLPDEGRIDLPLSPDPRRKGRFVARRDAKVPALTRYRVLERTSGLCLVEVHPETGRTHQIRVHLAAEGAPLAGDPLYGGPTELPGAEAPLAIGRVMLHARGLRLPHPSTSEPFEIQAPVPEDMKELAAQAGLSLSGV